MAATSDVRGPDAKHYVEYEEYVDYQLEKTRTIVKRTDILTTVTTLAVVVISYLLAFVVIDQWVIPGGFGYAARVGLLAVLFAGVVGMLAWRVLYPLLRRVHPLYAARVIEQSDPQLRSNLVNFVDVKMSSIESAPAVLKSMQKRAAVELSHIDVEEAVDHRPLLRVAYALLAVVVVAALYIVMSPKDPFASVRRALLPTASIDVATETEISDISPGDCDVPARTVQTIEADIRGKVAEHVLILFTTADHKYVDQPVEMRRIEESLPRFRGVLNGENGRGLLQSLKYRIIAGDAQSREFTINVIQPPSARPDDVHYVFPSYMSLDDRQTSGGDIDGWEGATVTVNATSNVPVKTATIVLTDTEDGVKGEESLMRVTDGTKLSASWPLGFRPDGTAARFYHIQVRTEDGKSDPDPTRYAYRIRPDQRPEVSLLAPTTDLDLPANAIIPLLIQAADPDFQLRSITLKAERGGDSFPDRRLFESDLPTQSYRGSADFPLEPLRLNAGETVTFWIEAKDNKQPTANRTNSSIIRVRVGKPASSAEVQKLLAEEKQKQQDQLQRADDPANPGDPAQQQTAGAGDKPDPQARRDQNPQPGEDSKPKQPTKNGSDDKADKPAGNDGPPDQPRKPASAQEALQRLLQKEQQEQKPNEQSGNEKQQPQRDDDQSNDPARNGQSNKPGNKPDQGDSSKTPQKSGSDRPIRDQQPPAGKNQSAEQDQQQSKKPQGADAATKPEKPSAADKQKNGSNDQRRQPGKAEEQKQNDGAGRKNDQSPDGAAKPEDKQPADQKPDDAKPKPQKGSEGNDQGSKPNADQKNPGKKPSADSQNTPGDKQQGTAPKPDAGQQKAGGDKPGTDEASKEGGDKGTPDKNTTDQQNPDKTEGAKNGPGKDDASKTEPGKDEDQQKGNDKPAGNKPAKSDQEKPEADDSQTTNQQKQKSGGAGRDTAAESDPAANDNDKSNTKGSPGKSKKPEGDKQEGEGQGEKSEKQGRGKNKPNGDSDPNAEQEPAEDTGDAQKRKATGNETGEATGDESGDKQAPKAKNDLQEKPGSKPGSKTQETSSEPQGKKTSQQRRPEAGTKNGSEDARNADRPPDGKKPTDQPGELDELPAPKSQKERNSKSENRPGQPPEAGEQELKGAGRPQGQKSEQADTGEEGSSAATKDGKPGGNKTGAGDKDSQPGDTDPASDQTGKPGEKQKGQGSSTKPSDNGQGNKQPGAGENPGKEGAGGTGGEKSEGQSGKPSGGESGGKSDQAGGKPAGDGKSESKAGSNAGGQGSSPGAPGSGKQSQNSGGGASSLKGAGDNQNNGGGGANADGDAPKPRDKSKTDEPMTPEEEAANLEYARKATNLVLKRLKSQLERGEVDQELLDELGWKDKQDVERFVKFLEQGLHQSAEDNSAEAEARRLQFEETLRSMDPVGETQSRGGSKSQERQIQQIGTKNGSAPKELEKAWEAYTRSLSKQANAEQKANGKKAPDKAMKR